MKRNYSKKLVENKMNQSENKSVSFGLQQLQRDGIINILSSNLKVKELLLFGSRAKGNFRQASDVDIAIKGDDLTLNDLLDLSNSLESLWLPFKIDLVNYSRISESDLIDHIDRVGKTLYKRN